MRSMSVDGASGRAKLPGRGPLAYLGVGVAMGYWTVTRVYPGGANRSRPISLWAPPPPKKPPLPPPKLELRVEPVDLPQELLTPVLLFLKAPLVCCLPR